ncbi:hypothetical protein EW146_g4521 [Bondarzewia mesenterica]|uniref:Protein CPL1-like domain-containing protein n=1 Tax=Bondarzewia mesenterica TaxID=1095465 RepID=A0A4S4LUB5_9AGAM|nr:hypothetical protein EW146_g4521 [Bondarzewia mesenterica]
MRLSPLFMRFLSSLSAVNLLVFPVFARFDFALRQHYEPRALLDVCAYIDADTLAHAGLVGIPANVLANLDLCLCLSALPLFLQTNANVKALVDILGNTAVDALLTALVNSVPSSRQCIYPAHSSPLCTKNDPCGHSCQPPYVPQNGQCVCSPPYKECNGKCGQSHKGCSSAVPVAKRDLRNAHQNRIHILAHAQAECAPGETVCGVYHGSAEFECVNTDNALESCGGCAIPNPFTSPSQQGPKGIDCTSLPGVLDVECSVGKCIVRRCRDDFSISTSGDECVPKVVLAKLTPQIRRRDVRRRLAQDSDSTASIDVSADLGSSKSSEPPLLSLDLSQVDAALAGDGGLISGLINKNETLLAVSLGVRDMSTASLTSSATLKQPGPGTSTGLVVPKPTPSPPTPGSPEVSRGGSSSSSYPSSGGGLGATDDVAGLVDVSLDHLLDDILDINLDLPGGPIEINIPAETAGALQNSSSPATGSPSQSQPTLDRAHGNLRSGASSVDDTTDGLLDEVAGLVGNLARQI